jgi:UDPglucose 6-dehydrogenase
MVVLGTGYLGATHAACMAELGHDVLGVDVDPAKLAKLEAGEVPFFEPGLGEVLHRHTTSGRLRFSSSYEEAAYFADVFFVTVATPQKKGEYGADLQFVDAAIATLAPLLEKPAVIVGKSTVPVGTAKRLGQLATELSPAGEAVEVAWNPEFLREGFAVQDTLHPDRLVLGIDKAGSGRAEHVAREIYAELISDGTPFIVTDLATAELVKVSANAFLATKISFINAIAEVCEAVDADVTVLADAIGYDGRIGRRFLNAGLGFGGGCLPKDIRAFMARAGELGANQALTFLREVDSINMRRRTRVVEIAREVCGGSFIGARVAVLGAAFKPDSDDVRDSPALNVAGQIQLQGATVNVFDPQAIDNSRALFPTLNYATSAFEACAGADAVLVLTEWAEFRSIDPAALKETVRSPCVIDGRNCLDASMWRAAGWYYRALGRPSLGRPAIQSWTSQGAGTAAAVRDDRLGYPSLTGSADVRPDSGRVGVQV